ncbi:MAG: phage terminase large subunit [Burkholderiales bacterium]|nr:phage terminase large subunit [Burkholderiales bacterium]
MKLSRREFQTQIAELAGGFRRTIEAEVAAFATDSVASGVRVERVCASDGGFEFFARTYFPHYVKFANSLLHDYLYEALPRMVTDPEGWRLALAAPRGEAKSTIVSQLFVLWCVVTGRKWYPLIIMDAFEQAAEMLEAIKAELAYNPRLAVDFPHACGQGRVWRAGVIVTANDCKIEAFGSAKRIRGRRHGPHRPDLVVCDDIESDENVAQPAQRDKLEKWVRRTVLSLGPVDDSMDVVIIGTVLHYDSVLSRFLKDPLWRKRSFRAILRFPDRMDLWDQWEETLLNTDDEGAAARVFYLAHQAEMERGAEVSWPAGRPLYALMVKRARDGHDAFDSEQQNDPLAGDDAPFANCLNFWVNRLAQWIFFGACDPSLGKLGSGRDPSAIGVGGFDRETGILDVVEASIARRIPDRIIEDIIAFDAEYRCLVWVVEAVQFQEFMRTELVKRSAARGRPVPARAIVPHADKALRILSLQPHMANGLLRTHVRHVALNDQFRHFPKADHDDGPDMVQMLWMAATSYGAPIEIAKLPQRSHAVTGLGDYL